MGAIRLRNSRASDAELRGRFASAMELWRVIRCRPLWPTADSGAPPSGVVMQVHSAQTDHFQGTETDGERPWPPLGTIAWTSVAVLVAVVAWSLYRAGRGEPPMRPQVRAAAAPSDERHAHGRIEVVDGHPPARRSVVYGEKGFTVSGWVGARATGSPPTRVDAVVANQVLGAAVPTLAPDRLWRFTIPVGPRALDPGTTSLRVDVTYGGATRPLAQQVRLVGR